MKFTEMNTNPLNIFLNSRDGFSIPATMLCFSDVAHILGRKIKLFSSTGLGIATTLNRLFPSIRESLGSTVRALWFEDDIIIRPTSENIGLIWRGIQYADENNVNLTANYHIVATDRDESTNEIRQAVANIYMHNNGWKDGVFNAPHYGQEEVQALKLYDPVELSGLGFYYGNINLDYIFHDDGLPIDINFHLDNKTSLRHLPLKIYHRKLIDI